MNAALMNILVELDMVIMWCLNTLFSGFFYVYDCQGFAASSGKEDLRKFTTVVTSRQFSFMTPEPYKICTRFQLDEMP